MKILVRKTEEEDLSAVLEMEQKAENRSFIYPYTKERHLEVIRRPDEFHYKILDKNEKLLGFIILAKTEKEHDSIEFRRIVITEKGKGFGRKAIQWAKWFSFEVMGCHRLWLDVFPENERAIHLYTSEGFEQEGMKKESIKSKDQRRSLVVMSILNTDGR